MKSVQKFVPYILLMIALVAVAGGIIVLQRWLSNEISLFSQNVNQELRKTSNLELHYRNLNPSIFSGLDVRALELRRTDGTVFLRLPRAIVHYDLFEILRGDVAGAMQSIECDSPELYFDAAKDQKLVELVLGSQTGNSALTLANFKQFLVGIQEFLSGGLKITIRNLSMSAIFSGQHLNLSVPEFDLSSSTEAMRLSMQVSGKFQIPFVLADFFHGNSDVASDITVDAQFFRGTQDLRSRLTIEDFSSSFINISRQSFAINLVDTELQCSKIEDAEPYDMRAAWNFAEGTLKFSFESESWSPSRLLKANPSLPPIVLATLKSSYTSRISIVWTPGRNDVRYQFDISGEGEYATIGALALKILGSGQGPVIQLQNITFQSDHLRFSYDGGIGLDASKVSGDYATALKTFKGLTQAGKIQLYAEAPFAPFPIRMSAGVSPFDKEGFGLYEGELSLNEVQTEFKTLETSWNAQVFNFFFDLLPAGEAGKGPLPPRIQIGGTISLAPKFAISLNLHVENLNLRSLLPMAHLLVPLASPGFDFSVIDAIPEESTLSTDATIAYDGALSLKLPLVSLDFRDSGRLDVRNAQISVREKLAAEGEIQLVELQVDPFRKAVQGLLRQMGSPLGPEFLDTLPRAFKLSGSASASLGDDVAFSKSNLVLSNDDGAAIAVHDASGQIPLGIPAGSPRFAGNVAVEGLTCGLLRDVLEYLCSSADLRKYRKLLASVPDGSSLSLSGNVTIDNSMKIEGGAFEAALLAQDESLALASTFDIVWPSGASRPTISRGDGSIKGKVRTNIIGVLAEAISLSGQPFDGAQLAVLAKIPEFRSNFAISEGQELRLALQDGVIVLPGGTAAAPAQINVSLNLGTPSDLLFADYPSVDASVSGTHVEKSSILGVLDGSGFADSIVPTLRGLVDFSTDFRITVQGTRDSVPRLSADLESHSMNTAITLGANSEWDYRKSAPLKVRIYDSHVQTDAESMAAILDSLKIDGASSLIPPGSQLESDLEGEVTLDPTQLGAVEVSASASRLHVTVPGVGELTTDLALKDGAIDSMQAALIIPALRDIPLKWGDRSGVLSAKFHMDLDTLKVQASLTPSGSDETLSVLYTHDGRLEVRGPWGVYVDGSNSSSGWTGFARAVGAPVTLAGTAFPVSFSGNYSFHDIANWTMNLTTMDLGSIALNPLQPDKAFRVTAAGVVIGPKRADVQTLRIQDQFSSMTGGVSVTMDHDSFVVGGKLTSSSKSSSASLEQWNVLGTISEQKMKFTVGLVSSPVERFLKFGMEGGIDLDADFEWSPGTWSLNGGVNLRRVSFNRDSLGGVIRFSGGPQGFSTSECWLQLVNTRFSASRLELSIPGGTIECRASISDARSVLPPTTLSLSCAWPRSDDLIGAIFNQMSGSLTLGHVPDLPEGYRDYLFAIEGKKSLVSLVESESRMITATLGSGGNFDVQVHKPFPLSASLTGSIQQGRIDANIGNLSAEAPMVLNAMFGAYMPVSTGQLSGNLRIVGDLNDPEIYGSLHGTNLTAKLSTLASSASAADIFLVFEEKTIRILPFVAVTEGAEADVSGEYSLSRWTPKSWFIEAASKDVKGIHIKSTFPNIAVDGFGMGRLRIDGLPNNILSFSGDLVMSSGALSMAPNTSGQSGSQADSGDQLQFRANLNFTSGKAVEFLWPNSSLPILRTNIDLDQHASFKYDGSTGTYRLSGLVSARGGELIYLKRNFYVRNAQISFEESEMHFDPIVTARADMRTFIKDKPARISVIIDHNPLSKLSPSFESDPSMSNEEIVSYLSGDTIPSSTGAVDLGRFAIGTTTDLVTQFGLLNNLEAQLKTVLGLDLLSVRTNIFENLANDLLLGASNPIDNSGSSFGKYFDNTTLVLGKYIGTDIYLELLSQLKTAEGGSSKDNPLGLKLNAELSIEWDTPFFLLDWSLTPKDSSRLFLPDNSFTFSWRL